MKAEASAPKFTCCQGHSVACLMDCIGVEQTVGMVDSIFSVPTEEKRSA